MDAIALTVPKDLNLNVPRGGEIFLDIDFVVAKGRFRLGTRGAKGLFHIVCGQRDLHAATATTGGGFDDDRIAEVFADLFSGCQIRDATFRARHNWDTQLLGGVFGGDLVAHGADVSGAWADEGQTVVFDDFHETCVLRQKAVTWVDRLCARDFAGCDDGRHVQIAVSTRIWADTDRFVCHTHVHCVRICGGMHRDRLDAHLAARADHAKCDFSAVGDEDFIKHREYLIR